MAHIKSHPRAGLFLEMGLGKTVSTLTAVKELQDAGELGAVLVVAPLMVAKSTWGAETEKWAHLEGLNVVPILGSKSKREKAMRNGRGRIFITNVENLEWLREESERSGIVYDGVVYDELSKFKSARCKRSRAAQYFSSQASRVIGLTGTPVPNGYMDLFGEMLVVDGGERLGTRITHYRERYFYPLVQNGHIVYKWGLKAGSKEAIDGKLRDIVVSMRSEDYLTLPPVTVADVKVELPAEAKKKYRELKEESITEIGGKEVTAQSAGVLCGKLLQATGGAVYTSVGGEEWEELHVEKIKVLSEIVDTSQGGVLVGYGYRHERERIMEALKAYEPRELRERADVEAWNRGEIKVAFGHPASIGHGLNLQAGGNTVVWFTLPYSLELYQQFNGRLARQGQKRAVVIHRLVAKGTIDERVCRVLEGKGNVQDALMEELSS